MSRTGRKPAPKPAPARETYLDQRDLDTYRNAAETGQPVKVRVERIYPTRKTARRAAQAHQAELKRLRRKAIAAGAFDPVAARTGRQSAQWKQQP